MSDNSQALSPAASTGGVYQRRLPRRPFSRAFGVLSRGEYFLVQGVELGEGGLGFTTDRAFGSGDQMLMSIVLPHSEMLFLRAEVKSVQKIEGQSDQRVGLAFVDAPDAARRGLRSFVTMRLGQQG